MTHQFLHTDEHAQAMEFVSVYLDQVMSGATAFDAIELAVYVVGLEPSIEVEPEDVLDGLPTIREEIPKSI